MNISSTSCFRGCTSCQMCSAVCPVNAIEISLNEDGFYRPTVNSNCIDCGKCIKVCYKFDDNLRFSTGDSLRSKYKLYGAYVNNQSTLYSCTSGGIADLLARYLYDSGYLCIGVKYDVSKNIAKAFCTDDVSDLNLFRGSKYIQAYNVDAFKALVRNVNKQSIAVFGLPCQIYAIDRYLRLIGKRNKCVLVDLFCHGCPSMNLWTKYISSRVDVTQIEDVSFRDKEYGWGTGYNIKLKLKDKSVISGAVGRDVFFRLFFSDLVLNDSCYNCVPRSTFEYTDIRLGDFWGSLYASNEFGVSAVSIITERAAKLWEQIKSETVYEDRTFDELLSHQSWGKSYKVDRSIRKELLSYLNSPDYTINEVYRYYFNNLAIVGKLKIKIKDVLFSSPRLVKAIKRLRK